MTRDRDTGSIPFQAFALDDVVTFIERRHPLFQNEVWRVWARTYTLDYGLVYHLTGPGRASHNVPHKLLRLATMDDVKAWVSVKSRIVMGNRHEEKIVDDALEQLITLFDELVDPEYMTRRQYVETMDCLIAEFTERRQQAIAEAQEDGQLDKNGHFK